MAVLSCRGTMVTDSGSAPLAKAYLKSLRTQAVVGEFFTWISAISPRRLRRDNPKPDRIGIFCQWGVGDAVLLLPLLRGLRMSFPDTSLELIGKPWLEELFADEGCCDRTHILVPPWTAYQRKYRPTPTELKSYLSQIGRLRKESFDWLISPRFDPREIMQARLLRARVTYGFRSAGGRDWITNDLGFTRKTHDSMHRADLAAELCRVIGAATVANGASFRRRPPALGWLERHGYQGGGVLAVHSGAGHPIRRWRDHHFSDVLGGLNVKPGLVVFIEDPGGAEMSWDGPLRHMHWRGDLTGLKTVLASCNVFLGTDSGVMHMAAAAGCDVVAVFGPTRSEWFGPFGANHETIHEEQMPCRPCFDNCIHSIPICMQNINTTRIIKAVDERLEKFQSPS
jgi:ADP-heptose:LPS heptosyltransferase